MYESKWLLFWISVELRNVHNIFGNNDCLASFVNSTLGINESVCKRFRYESFKGGLIFSHLDIVIRTEWSTIQGVIAQENPCKRTDHHITCITVTHLYLCLMIVVRTKTRHFLRVCL